MARITSPTGEQMQDTEDVGLLAYYERRGYTIERTAEEAAALEQPDGDEADGDGAVPVPDGAPTDAWTVAQLRTFAKAHDVDLGGATLKADILAALAPADGEQKVDGAPTE
jgi:hypothetical protein